MTKILVVDDSVFMCTVIRDMISKDPSLEVVGTAIDGVDALNKLESLSPDVMTLDIEMPRMSGIEVLEKIEKWPSRPRILMLSSLTAKDAEMTRRAIELGADDFMLKPTDLPRVRDIGDETSPEDQAYSHPAKILLQMSGRRNCSPLPMLTLQNASS